MQIEKTTTVHSILISFILISLALGCSSTGKNTHSNVDTSSDTSIGTDSGVVNDGPHAADSISSESDSDTSAVCASGQRSCDDNGTMLRLCLDGEWTQWDDCSISGKVCRVVQGTHSCVTVMNQDTGNDTGTDGRLDSLTGSDTGVDSVTGTDLDTDTDTGVDTGTSSGMDTVTASDAAVDTNTGHDTSTVVVEDTDVDTVTDTDTGDVDTVTDTDTGTDTVIDTGTDTDTDTDTGTGVANACMYECLIHCASWGGTIRNGACEEDLRCCEGATVPDTETEPAQGQFTVTVSTSSEIPTVGIVEWSIYDVTVDQASIEFGLTTEYGMEAPVELNEPNFRTLLLGLKANTAYQFRIVVQSGGDTWTSENYTLQSGDALNITPPIVDMSQAAKAADGFVVMATYNSTSIGVQTPMALVFSSDGDLVWWYQSSLPDNVRARMSYDGKWMALMPSNNAGNSGSIEMVSMDGEAEKSYAIAGAAHDITPMPDNTFAYLEYTSAGGMMATECAKVMALDEEGNTTLIFDSASLWGDNCHGAALRYSSDEDLFTIADYNHGQIAAVDRAGQLQWVTQNSGIWEFVHGHQLLDDNHLLVFDNGADFSAGTVTSRALRFTIDSGGNLIENWSYSVENLGCPLLGDVQLLSNGNTLVSYSGAAIIHEVDTDGLLVREWDFGVTQFGYVVWRPTLYGPPVDLDM